MPGRPREPVRAGLSKADIFHWGTFWSWHFFYVISSGNFSLFFLATLAQCWAMSFINKKQIKKAECTMFAIDNREGLACTTRTVRFPSASLRPARGWNWRGMFWESLWNLPVKALPHKCFGFHPWRAGWVRSEPTLLFPFSWNSLQVTMLRGTIAAR